MFTAEAQRTQRKPFIDQSHRKDAKHAKKGFIETPL